MVEAIFCSVAFNREQSSVTLTKRNKNAAKMRNVERKQAQAIASLPDSIAQLLFQL